MIVLTAQQMREVDRLTIYKYGVPSLVLMERAGEAVAQVLVERFAAVIDRGVLVVAGKGNNGGDGLVVARLLRKKRVPCQVALLARKEELSADAAQNLQAYTSLRGSIVEIRPTDSDLLSRHIESSALIVDAILGTGMKNEVRGFYADVITRLNASGLPVLAVDMPSGLDSDTGIPLGVAVQADITVALGFAKTGQVIYPGVDYTGDLVIADIGLDPAAVDEVAPTTEILTPEEIQWLVPLRSPDTHKGTYGHVVVMAGARGKTGAAVLACRAAMRAGAGLVTLASPRALNDIFASSLVEVMTEPLGGGDTEELPDLSAAEWTRLLKRKNALLFGPGIGVSDSTRRALRWLLANLEVPWVIDADGLNNLALDLDRLRAAKVAPVLTPHPGEMARLIGKDTAAVGQDRIAVARAFSTENRCHVVLKGARTVIATADGKVFVNPTGNPGMASGGMGDVLAGILAALLGQGFAPEDAMRLGVYLHGFVGDRAAEEKGPIGIVASDIIEGLPAGLAALANAEA